MIGPLFNQEKIVEQLLYSEKIKGVMQGFMQEFIYANCEPRSAESEITLGMKQQGWEERRFAALMQYFVENGDDISIVTSCVAEQYNLSHSDAERKVLSALEIKFGDDASQLFRQKGPDLHTWRQEWAKKNLESILQKLVPRLRRIHDDQKSVAQTVAENYGLSDAESIKWVRQYWAQDDTSWI